MPKTHDKHRISAIKFDDIITDLPLAVVLFFFLP